MAPLVCRAIVFDLDGVLVDSSVVVERHWRRWAARRGVDYARIAAVMHGRRSAEVMALIAPHLDAERESRDFEGREAVDTDGLRVYSGAAALLRSLPPRQWAIATSGTVLTASTRLCFGRLPVPDALVTAEDISRGKPAPDAYLLAAARLGVAAASCVVVEDSPAGAGRRRVDRA
jgi:sugar-phosphatase